MRKTLAVMLTLAAANAWAGDLSREDWRVTRQIVLPQMSAPALVYLPLDAQALTVKSLSEYRVVSDGGAEVPYRMITEDGRSETRVIPSRIVSQGTLAKRQVQAIVDVGPGLVFANGVELQLGGDNFRSRVRVEGSHDRARWWLLQDRGLVYRHEGRFEQTTVQLPSNDYRFLRITISRLQGDLPALTAVRIVGTVTVPRVLVAADAKLSRREDTKSRSTILTLDLALPTRDLARATFDVQDATFDRPLTMEAAPNQKDYQWLGDYELRRLKTGQAVAVPFQIAVARRLRFSISNGDDRPLVIAAVKVFRVRRGLIFSADSGHKYELWYGRRDAPAPVYDIQRLPLTTPPGKLAVAGLGPEHKLPPKPPPPPSWSEKHPGLFWGALAAVVVLLAIVIIRAMRGVKAAPPEA